MNYHLNQWKKLNNYMFSQLQHNVILQLQALIYGCHKLDMMFFTLVINFFNVDQQLKHITFALFEPITTNGQTLVINLTLCIEEKIIAYVKDEGSNLNTIITTLKSIVRCDMLVLEENFQGICSSHAFFYSLPICQNKGETL